MLPVTPAWLQGMRVAGIRPAILLDLTINGQTFRWCRASRPLNFNGSTSATPNILDKVGAVGWKMNHITRKVSITETSLTFNDDAFLRNLLATSSSFGGTVVLTRGPEELAPSAQIDFLPLWGGVVVDIEPVEGILTLRCHDTLSLLSGDVQEYSAVNKHPLQVALDVFAIAVGGAQQANGLPQPALPWTPATNFTLGQIVFGAGLQCWLCTTPGLTGQTAPAWPGAPSYYSPPTTITDGTVVWSYMGLETYFIQGASFTPWSYQNTGAIPGVPANLVNIPSFNPDLYSGGTYPTSHWSITRAVHDGVDRHISQAEKGLDVLDEIGLLMGGAIFSDETGKAGFTQYDPNAPSVDTFTLDDINDVRQTTATGSIFNRAKVLFGWDGKTQGMDLLQRSRWTPYATAGTIPRKVVSDDTSSNAGYRFAFVRDDLQSQMRYAYPGQGGRMISERIESKWLGLRACLSGPGPFPAGAGDLAAYSSPGDTVGVYGGWVGSFCGVPRLHNAGGGKTISDGTSNYGLSPQRPGYLLIDQEIIAVSAALVPGAAGGSTSTVGAMAAISVVDQFGIGGQWSSVAPNGFQAIVFTILQRGALGTVAAAHKGTSSANFNAGTIADVWDVTIPAAIAQRFLDRFPDGCPEIVVDAKLHKGPTQIGDEISLSNDVVLYYKLPANLTAAQWEVVGKTEDVTADVPKIQFSLALARTPPPYSGIYVPILTPPAGTGGLGVGGFGGIGQNPLIPPIASRAVISNVGDVAAGFIAAAGGGLSDLVKPSFTTGGSPAISGLNVTIPAGTASRPGVITNVAAITLPLPANADTYVYFDHGTSQMCALSLPTGTAPPMLSRSQALHSVYRAATSSATLIAQAQSGAQLISGQASIVPPHSDGIPLAWLFDREVTNYISNPSFENNATDGWTFSNGGNSGASFTKDTSTFQWGTASGMWVHGAGGFLQELKSTDIVATTNGIPWAFSVDFTSASTLTFNLIIEFLAADKSTVLESNSKNYPSIASPGWGTRAFVKATGVSGSIAYVRARITSASQSITSWWDGLQLEKDHIWATSYCDGSLGPGYSWNGAAHASSSSRTNGWQNIGGLDSAVARPTFLKDDGTLVNEYIIQIGTGDTWGQLLTGGPTTGTGSDGGVSLFTGGILGTGKTDLALRLSEGGKFTAGASGLYYGATTSMTQNVFIAPLNATKEWEYTRLGAGSHYATGTGILTIPEAGVYWIFAGWRIGGSSGKEFVMELWVNGASIFDSPDFFDGAGAGGLAQEMCRPWLFAKNDTVQIKCFNGGVTAALDGSRGNYFGWMRAH